MIVNIIYTKWCFQSLLKVNYSNPRVKALAPYSVSHTQTHTHCKFFLEAHTPACNFNGFQLICDSAFDISFQNHLMLEGHTKASKRQNF